jgi:hypothetical protein
VNRALINCSLGNETECDADIQRASELGFDADELRQSIADMIEEWQGIRQN